MAQFILRPRSFRTQDVYPAVYAKRAWADDWTFLPYLTCLSCSDVLAPNIPTAEFEARFGSIRRSGTSAFATWLPYFVNGAYIKVVSVSRFGAEHLWTGVVDAETVTPYGDTARASGIQRFTAYGLEQLLDRDTMRGSYTVDGYTDREIVFNGGRTYGLTSATNRQTDAYTFGAGSSWSNADIIQYILDKYLNTTAITYALIGDTSVLSSITEEHDLSNMTPWQALNRLIEPRRGITWKLVDGGLGTVYITVFSLHTYPVQVQDVTIPANSWQTDVNFSGDASVEQSVVFNRQNLYRRVVGVGGDLSVCASFSYADGTLEADWTSTQETDYKAGTGTELDEAELHDANRGRDEWESVYQRFRIPDTWDGTTADGQGNTKSNAIPIVNRAGFLDTTQQSNFHREGLVFEREIPFAQTKNASGVSEYRQPFLLCKVEDPNNASTYLYAMAKTLNALGYPSISVNGADTDLAIQTDSTVNHVGALNHFDTADAGTYDSNVEPITDWQDYIYTGFFKTGQKVIVDSANLGFPVGEVDRTKVIQLPEAEMWYVVPTTVYGVSDGVPLEHAGGLVRDDSKWVRLAVFRALAWYGQPRAQLEYRIKYIAQGLPTGMMVRNMRGPEGYTPINTVVTQRIWNFDAGRQSTTITTGYIELEFSRRFKDDDSRRRWQKVRALKRRQTKLPGRRGR